MSPDKFAALRADFEAAVRENHDVKTATNGLRQDENGDYTTVWVNAAWWGWQEHARRAGSAPDEKPKTRRDINVNRLSPGVRALHDAFIYHDSAAMELFGRDDQVAWIGKGPAPAAHPVTVGQLREVLVAALGLPAGTKFGG